MEDETPQNLAHIHWSWPEAIAANPAHSLATPDLAMDYFAYSPFWDAQSNNNQLRTQRRVENPTYGHAEEKVELASFRGGFEYIIAHARAPDVFVIHRRPVLSDGGRGPVTHAYFVLQDKIYMAPNLYDIAQTRLRNATHMLEKTFATLEKSRPAANPRATAHWLAVAREEKKDPEDKEGKAGSTGTPGTEDKEKDLKDTASASSHTGGPTAAGPDWHLFHALTSTRAALADMDKLAAGPAPEFDEAAEARAMEQLAAAAVGRPVPSSAAVAALPNRSRAGSVLPTSFPTPTVGTPLYAPSPLRRAGMPFPTDSPAPM